MYRDCVPSRLPSHSGDRRMKVAVAWLGTLILAFFMGFIAKFNWTIIVFPICIVAGYFTVAWVMVIMFEFLIREE